MQGLQGSLSTAVDIISVENNQYVPPYCSIKWVYVASSNLNLNAAVNILEKRPPSSEKIFWPMSLAGKNMKKEKENGEISKKSKKD